MAAEIRQFEVTVSAGTAKTSPATTDLSMPPRIVTGVRVRVPPGPAGVVGFALGASGQRVLPWNADAWIVADDEVLDWPLEQQIDSGAWQLQAYNTGVYDHTLYLTFYLLPVGEAAGQAIPTPLAL